MNDGNAWHPRPRRVLAACSASPAQIWRRVRRFRAGSGRGRIPLRCRRPARAGLHLGPDERGARPFASRDRGDGARRHRPARSPVLLDAQPAGRRSRRGFGRAGAATAESHAAIHRGRGQRGGHQARETRHRRMGGGGVRAVVARHDRRCRFGYLQGRTPRLRSDGGGLLRDTGAERLSPPFRGRRLAGRARRQFRPDRPAKHGQPRRLHRRADPQQRRRLSSCRRDTLPP